MNGFLQLPRAILKVAISDGAKIKYALLLDLGRTHGFAWPTLDQLAEMAGGSRRAAVVQVQELITAGLVSKVKSGRRVEYRTVHIMHSSNSQSVHKMHSTSAENALVSNVREQELDNKNNICTPLGSSLGDSMAKIVSPVTRSAQPSGDDSKRPGKRTHTPVDNLIYWYGSLPFGNRDDSNSAKKCWSNLLQSRNGDIEKVKALVIEARKNKHRVVNEKYPKFTIHSVLFYDIHIKLDESDAPENEPINEIAKRKITECMNAEGPLDVKRIAQLVSMFDVRWEQVQRAFSDSECDILFNAVGDETWGTNRGNPAAVSG